MSLARSGKPVPNLDLMSKIAGAWDAKMKKVVAKNKDLRKYMGKGGVRIPAILTRIFPLGDGTNVFSRGFECYLLNAHGAEPEDCDAFVKGTSAGNESIKVKVRFNPKADAPPPPAAMGPVPTEDVLRSRTTRHFQTGEFDCLDKEKPGHLKPGQIVVLNGVNARAYVPRDSTNWGIAYDVQLVEPVHGLTLTSLYEAGRGTGTDYMMPNDFFFDEAVPSSRYNRAATHFVSVFAPSTTEEGRHERLERMAREKGETRLVNRDWSNKTWEIEAAQGRTRAMKASLDLVHTQWPVDTDIEKYREVMLLGVSLWSEQLIDFGILDIDAWIELAPMIFDKLDFKVIGYVDTKGTEVNFGGVTADKDVDFALQLGGMGIIADIESCYRRIGIPVTADCVTDLQQMPGGSPGGGIAIDDEFIEKLPAVVPVTGAGASSAMARKLVDIGRTVDSKLEFRALIKYNPSPAVIKGLATLDAEEGSALVNALATNSDAEIVGDAKVHGLWEMMATGKDSHVVAFAFCNTIIPDDIKSQRNRDLITYMTGKAPLGAAAIEAAAPEEDASASAAAAAAPAVEELNDDESEPDSEPSRKRSSKKMGKPKKKKTRRA